MSKRNFIQILILILTFGVVVYLVTPKYDFYHQNIRRNRFSGKIEKYDADLDRWGTRKELQKLRESQSVHPRRELIDDLGILGTRLPTGDITHPGDIFFTEEIFREEPGLLEKAKRAVMEALSKVPYVFISALFFALLIFLRIKRFLRNAPRQSMNGKDG